MVALSTLVGPVDRAALGHRAGRHDLSAGGARRRRVVGSRTRRWSPASAAALAYNFFFTAPVHTFRMDRLADVVTVIVLLLVALVTSHLAAGIRDQARLAAAHAARNATIAGFARRLLSCSSEQDIAAPPAPSFAAVRLQRDAGRGLARAAHRRRRPEGNRLTPSDLAAAALTLESGEPAGRGSTRIQPAEWQFHPVRSGDA